MVSEMVSPVLAGVNDTFGQRVYWPSSVLYVVTDEALRSGGTGDRSAGDTLFPAMKAAVEFGEAKVPEKSRHMKRPEESQVADLSLKKRLRRSQARSRRVCRREQSSACPPRSPGAQPPASLPIHDTEAAPAHRRKVTGESRHAVSSLCAGGAERQRRREGTVTAEC